MTVYDVTINENESLRKVYIAAKNIFSAMELLKMMFPEADIMAIIAFEGEFYIALEDEVQ